MTPAQKAILKTLAYADIFDYPLNKTQIKTWLIWQPKSSPPSLNPALKLIPQTQSYYHLPNRQRLVKLRRQKTRFSQSKWQLAQKATRWLKFIPFINLIAVTGALTMNNSAKNDDIDLMIITQTNRLWLTRLFSTLILELLCLRRRPHGQITNKICLNLFLDQSAIKLPVSQRNLYTAHEIAQIKPLFDRGGIYQKFLLANSWIKNHLPHAVNISTLKSSPSQSSPPPFFERLAFKLQYAYMKSKITHEKVTLHTAFFHPRQTNQLVLKQYHQKLKQLHLND